MYEVKAAGVSLGIAKLLKDAEFWYSKVTGNSKAQLFEIGISGSKTLVKERNGNGFLIRDTVQSVT